jgi:DNA-binding GntR family transcriptional regulator
MKRCAPYCLPHFAADPESGEPLYRQLYRFLRSAIERGEPAGGSRLPSTRGLAEQLRVSRNTVLTAYEMLAADGLVTGRIGSGTRVRRGAAHRTVVPSLPDLGALLRAAHFPVSMMRMADPDGNSLCLIRVSE